MAIDFEPNNTAEQAVITARLGSTGYLNESLGGTIASAGLAAASDGVRDDPSDWWRVPLSDDVTSVRVQSYNFWYTSELLIQPGVNGETRQLSFGPGSNFTGIPLTLEARYGLDAHSVAYGTAINDMALLVQEMSTEFIRKSGLGILDETLVADTRAASAVITIASGVLETDGSNADYLQIVADIRHELDANLGGSEFASRLRAIADRLSNVVDIWENGRYFRVEGGTYTEIPSLLTLTLPTYGANVAGGDGMVEVTGFARANNGDGTTTLDDVLYNILLVIGGSTGPGPGEVKEGGPETDLLKGGEGDDTLNGLEGNDRLEGGPGGDTLNGGPGMDSAYYLNAIAAVALHLGNRLGTAGEASGDVFDSIENIHGSVYSDELTGDEVANLIIAEAGDDRVNGMQGADTLIGGLGNDTLDGGSNPSDQGDFLLGGDGDDTYHVDSPFDFVDEGSVFPEFGFGGTDTIISTADFYWDLYSVGENLIASEAVVDMGNDGVTIVGSVFSNAMVGHSGIDIMFGRGGSDTYRPGGGIDFLSFSTLGLTDANAYAGVDGVNTLVMAPGNSYDIVFEFEAGKDRVDLTAFDLASNTDLFARGFDDGIGNSYFVLGDGFDYLYMVGLELADLQAGDFIV